MNTSSSSSQESQAIELVHQQVEEHKEANQRIVAMFASRLGTHFDGLIADIVEKRSRQETNLKTYATLYESIPIIHEEEPLKRTLIINDRHVRDVHLEDAADGNVFFLTENDLRYEMNYQPESHTLTCNEVVITRGGESFQGKPINIISRREKEEEDEEEIFMHPQPGMLFVNDDDEEEEDVGPLPANEDDCEDGYYRDTRGKVIRSVFAFDKSTLNEYQCVKYYADQPWLVKSTAESEAMNVIFRNLHNGEVRRYILSRFDAWTSFMLGGEFYYIRNNEANSHIVECRSGKHIVFLPYFVRCNIVSCGDYAVYSRRDYISFITLNTRRDRRIHPRVTSQGLEMKCLSLCNPSQAFSH